MLRIPVDNAGKIYPSSRNSTQSYVVAVQCGWYIYVCHSLRMVMRPRDAGCDLFALRVAYWYVQCSGILHKNNIHIVWIVTHALFKAVKFSFNFFVCGNFSHLKRALPLSDSLRLVLFVISLHIEHWTFTG